MYTAIELVGEIKKAITDELQDFFKELDMTHAEICKTYALSPNVVALILTDKCHLVHLEELFNVVTAIKLRV